MNLHEMRSEKQFKLVLILRVRTPNTIVEQINTNLFLLLDTDQIKYNNNNTKNIYIAP